jgi:hypothetical protein
VSNNILIKASRALFLDLVAEILYFPLWWYSAGLKSILLGFFANLKEAERNLGLGLLFRHMFQPMFGQADREGRIISFFMRLLIVAYKSVLFVCQFILYLLVVIFWLALPPLVVVGLFYNAVGIWQK